MMFSFFFVKKKNRMLKLVQNYQKLNVITRIINQIKKCQNGHSQS